jgi:hypothetical protein
MTEEQTKRIIANLRSCGCKDCNDRAEAMKPTVFEARKGQT